MRRNDDPLAEARDPRTPPDRLWLFATGYPAAVARAAVSNPNFPIGRLAEECLNNIPSSAWDSVIDNPSIFLFMMTASHEDIGGIAVACAVQIDGELKRLYTRHLDDYSFHDLCEYIARGKSWLWDEEHPRACRLLFDACVAMAAHEAFVATSHRMPFEVSLSPKALGYIHYAITEWKPNVTDELRRVNAVPKCVAQANFTPNRRRRQ